MRRAGVIAIGLVVVVIGLRPAGAAGSGLRPVPEPVRLVSAAADGTPGNGQSRTGLDPVVSRDGRYVLFRSSATNLTSAPDGRTGVYRKDLRTGTVVGLDTHPDPAWLSVVALAVTDDGRHALVGHGDGTRWLHDIEAEATVAAPTDAVDLSGDGRRVLVAPLGAPAEVVDLRTGRSWPVPPGCCAAALSGNGEWVSMITADALDASDTDAQPDCYLVAVRSGAVHRLPADDGHECVAVAMSDDARVVVTETQPLGSEVRTVTVHDRRAGTRVTVPQVRDFIGESSIDASGRVVAFMGTSADFTTSDIFTFRPATGSVHQISVDIDGGPIDGVGGVAGLAGFPGVSADGRTVTFIANAIDLVIPATDGTVHVFQADVPRR